MIIAVMVVMLQLDIEGGYVDDGNADRKDDRMIVILPAFAMITGMVATMISTVIARSCLCTKFYLDVQFLRLRAMSLWAD